jgi:hypothetical protein
MNKDRVFYHFAYFPSETPQSLLDAVWLAYQLDLRCRVWIGDTTTGEGSLDEFEVLGTIGRSTGPLHVPLLVEEGDDGGPELYSDLIVRIDVEVGVTWFTLYQHPTFHMPELTLEVPSDMPEYAANVRSKGEIDARFLFVADAQQYIDFMLGKSHEVPKP